MDAPLVIIPRHLKEMNDYEAERALGRTVSGEEVHRINCPYEPAGAAIVTVQRRAGEIKLPVGRIVKCDRCGRAFRVAPVVKLIGKKLEEYL